jgi:hypothetical protein
MPRYGKQFGRAMSEVTGMTDSVVDDELKAMAAKKAPKVEVEISSEGEEGEEEGGELTPDEVERLRALLARQGE